MCVKFVNLPQKKSTRSVRGTLSMIDVGKRRETNNVFKLTERVIGQRKKKKWRDLKSVARVAFMKNQYLYAYLDNYLIDTGFQMTRWSV